MENEILLEEVTEIYEISEINEVLINSGQYLELMEKYDLMLDMMQMLGLGIGIIIGCIIGLIFWNVGKGILQ